MKFTSWADAAKFCEKTFGSYIDWDEGFFICPECCEPIYESDWDDHDNWSRCPICDIEWEYIE